MNIKSYFESKLWQKIKKKKFEINYVMYIFYILIKFHGNSIYGTTGISSM